MTTRGDRMMVLVYALLVALPVAARALHLPDRKLVGVVPPLPAVKLTRGHVLSGEYQAAWAEAFERRLGLRGAAITADNTILYHAFRETKRGSTAVVGKDGVLLPEDDLHYYAWQRGDDPPLGRDLDALAAKISRAQARMRAQGRAFVPIIVPAKTSVWRDEIPDSWKRGDTPPESDRVVYGALREALDRRGVLYVDARSKLTRSTEPREWLWGREARHWSFYGACLVMQDVVAAYAELTGRPLLPHPCQLEHLPNGDPRHPDNDLRELMNVAFLKPAQATLPAVVFQPPPPGERPSLLVVSTSFGWTLVSDAESSRVFGDLVIDYYDRRLVKWPRLVEHPAIPHTPEWNEAVLGRDVYVLDLLESFVGAPDSFASRFLDAFLAESPGG